MTSPNFICISWLSFTSKPHSPNFEWIHFIPSKSIAIRSFSMSSELRLENLFSFLWNKKEMGNGDGWILQKLTFWHICGIIRLLPFAWNFNQRRDLRPLIFASSCRNVSGPFFSFFIVSNFFRTQIECIIIVSRSAFRRRISFPAGHSRDKKKAEKMMEFASFSQVFWLTAFLLLFQVFCSKSVFISVLLRSSRNASHFTLGGSFCFCVNLAIRRKKNLLWRYLEVQIFHFIFGFLYCLIVETGADLFRGQFRLFFI